MILHISHRAPSVHAFNPQIISTCLPIFCEILSKISRL